MSCLVELIYMPDRPTIFKVLFGGANTWRAHAVLFTGIAIAIGLYALLLYLYISNADFRLAVATEQFQAGTFAFVVTTTIGFFIAPATFLMVLLERLLLHKNDLIFKDRAWKRRIEQLFSIQLGVAGTILALICGSLFAVLFDLFLARNIFPSAAGHFARILSDIYVFLVGMCLFVALVWRRR